MAADILESLGLDLIPAPRRILGGDGALRLDHPLAVVVEAGALATAGAVPGGPGFAAAELAACLRDEHGLDAAVRTEAPSGATPVYLRLRDGGDGDGARRREAQAYRLEIGADGVAITAPAAAGLFYGTQTLLQVLTSSRDRGRTDLAHMTIDDDPALEMRAVHYDTKHHQGTLEYVQGLIRELARCKVNTLVWEWEDKLAYERHPEIGAPGAFTKAQMGELTAYAAQRHVQLVPLVQGLGHVSFILKHPQHRHLREIPDSAWEFCPLREGSYELLFDLWDEAMEATPGVDWLHIGSDETYELGQGRACGCQAQAEQIGREGLMQVFLRRAVEHVESRGRRALSWGGVYRPGTAHPSPPGLVYTDGTELQDLRASCEAGYDVLVYSPNPGIEPLFLGHFPWVQSSMWRDEHVRERAGTFADTARACAAAGAAAPTDSEADGGDRGRVLGTITTSWDDSGLHTQMWMPRFLCAAEYSWSSGAGTSGPDLDIWIDRFLRHYYGPETHHLRELFELLGEGALFYYDTFQRRIWHWGDIGKIHLPDLPRAELEFSPFWRRRYHGLLVRAREERQRCARAGRILADNLADRGAPSPRHRYDLELMATVAALMRHNVDLVLLLGDLEAAIAAAHGAHFADRAEALARLRRALALIEDHLADRRRVFDDLVATWERTRLPKGLSLPGQPFLHAPDRARHFADRTPDMAYLIRDEELLDLEGYATRLRDYVDAYARGLAGPRSAPS